jgi:hypothetical protein
VNGELYVLGGQGEKLPTASIYPVLNSVYEIRDEPSAASTTFTFFMSSLSVFFVAMIIF